MQYRSKWFAWVLVALLVAWSLAVGCADAHGEAGASVQVQVMSQGHAGAGMTYTLTAEDVGVLGGQTDASGLIVAGGLPVAAWRLAVGCADAVVWSAEVHGQADQVDATCKVYLAEVMR